MSLNDILDQVEFEKGLGVKVLVTGANGYLGQGIVKQLLDDGTKVIATDLSVEHVDNRAEKMQCDLFSAENPYEYFGEPDVLLHLAWRDGFVHNSDAHIGDLNKHCQFIKKFSQTDIKKIAVMGSMHEVGFYEGSVEEQTPCNPMTPYGIAKNALRQFTQNLLKGTDITCQWLRGYYIVGNSEHGSSVFSKITVAEKEGKAEFPFVTGQNQYDFIDYDEFVKQVSAVISQDEIDGIVNICSGRPEKLIDRVEQFISENGYHIELKCGAFPDRPYDSVAIWGNNNKIKRVLEKAESKLKQV